MTCHSWNQDRYVFISSSAVFEGGPSLEAWLLGMKLESCFVVIDFHDSDFKWLVLGLENIKSLQTWLLAWQLSMCTKIMQVFLKSVFHDIHSHSDSKLGSLLWEIFLPFICVIIPSSHYLTRDRYTLDDLFFDLSISSAFVNSTTWLKLPPNFIHSKLAAGILVLVDVKSKVIRLSAGNIS